MSTIISVHSGLEFITSNELSDEEIENIEEGLGNKFYLTHMYPNPHFLKQAEGIKEGYYKCKFSEEEISLINKAKKTNSFPEYPKNYRGFDHLNCGLYNEWRAILSKLVVGEDILKKGKNESGFKDKPFFEILNFSDCEGIIGPKTSKKLFGDFIKYEEKAKEYSSDTSNEGFYDNYKKWKEIFELASSEKGVVCFG